MSDSPENSEQSQAGQELDRDTQLFLSLVTSMHMGAMYQLGKVASPISGKVERDLKQAHYTIELLGMLESRTKGNLVGDEGEYLTRVLSELRMNFVDESSKPDAPDAADAPDAPNAAEATDTADATGTEDQADSTSADTEE